MDENIMHITWETGYMTIVLDGFFPCSQDKLKKLLKVVELDWRNQDELKEKLKVYFQNKKSEYETKAAETCHFHIRQENERIAYRFQRYFELVK